MFEAKFIRKEHNFHRKFFSILHKPAMHVARRSVLRHRSFLKRQKDFAVVCTSSHRSKQYLEGCAAQIG